jgi:hypothetical protein
MAALSPNTVGILPPGALGVSFFFHLTQQLRRLDNSIVFIERRNSASAQALRQHGQIAIATPTGLASIATEQVLRRDLIACYEEGDIPDLVLVCPNPDQLLNVVTTSVELLVRIYETENLQTNSMPFPTLIFCSNGIYFQRLRQIFIEKLEEATLFGRLPDLWPDLMPQIVSRFLRGVTIQTGVREGSGANTLYLPGPRGLTRLAGSDTAIRQRCCDLLSAYGGWFESVGDRSPTRLEFDKALVNLTCNLLGQIYAIDAEGQFQALCVGEIVVPAHYDEIQKLTQQVFMVGQQVRAYRPDEQFDVIYQQLIQVCQAHADHVPSSLQWVALNLRLGTLKPEITPTEGWLLEPMIRYARAADLSETAQYFERLKHKLLQALKRAIAHAEMTGAIASN